MLSAPFYKSRLRTFLKVTLRPWRHQILTAVSKLCKRRPVLILTQRKTGSTSVACSILQSCRYTAVVRTAHLSRDVFPTLEKKEGRLSVVYSDAYYLISLVRNPFDQAFSDTFRVMARGYKKVSSDVNVWQRMSQRFVKRSLVWFDKQLKRFTGIDVYAHPFATTNGYQVYSTIHHHLLNRIDLLVLRTELNDSEKSLAIGKFPGLKQFRIIRANQSKDYPSEQLIKIYDEMKHRVKFSPGFVDRVCTHQYTKHFFSTGEIDAMRARWSE